MKSLLAHILLLFCTLVSLYLLLCTLLSSQGSPGVGRNTLFLSSPHICFIIVFICDLIVSRDDPLMN